MAATFPRTMGYGLGSSIQRGTSAFGPWVTADPYDYPLRDQTMITAPTFPPFKFEPRRARIDWRLLHGIDINAMVRDVDLDTLEKIVNIVAFGDIEAEDTRHLTELNFIKIFRLSQMMIEYLLYVQDCLQSSNSWLQQDRSNMDKYVQAARLRIRELEANLKMNKRELRRTRKTVKTYELLAVLNDGKANNAATMPAPTATFATTAAPTSPPPQHQAQQQAQLAKSEPNPVNVAMEALLRKELAVLGERLSKATLECQTLRAERDDLFQAVKDLEAAVKAKPPQPEPTYYRNAEIQGLQEQLNRATVEITKLRSEKSDLVEELERANSEKRQLHEEKSRLLTEIAARPETPRAESQAANDNLGSLLLEAEKQKAAIQDQLADARAEITALQKQLMKAMKATAFGGPMAPPADERLVRDFEAAVRELEMAKGRLEEMERIHNDYVQQLRDELHMERERAQAAERRIAELRAASPGSPQRTGGRMDSPQHGGLVKISPEHRGGYDDLEEAERHRAMLAEYEAVNERMNQQMVQLKEERDMLAEEVEQLRMQMQGRSPHKQQGGEQGFNRDRHVEEMELLKSDYDAEYRRNLDLKDMIKEKDALIERLRNTIRELQAQLDERTRQTEESDAALSRVKQQVQHFERMAGAAPKIASQSFSFMPDDQLPASVHGAAETPTARKAHFAEMPSRSHSPALATMQEMEGEGEDGEVAPPAEYSAPSPRRPEQLLDPSKGSQFLRRFQRPSPAEANLIQQSVMKHVAGMTPEALEMSLQEEIRVITENPYPYEGDEEEIFKTIMPYEMEGRAGVRSVLPHSLQDLEGARMTFTDQLLAVVDDEMATYGVDLAAETLSDKAYAACMTELRLRRSKKLDTYPRELKERAENLREYLLTHLELAKRGEQRRRAVAQQEELQAEQRRLGSEGAGALARNPEPLQPSPAARLSPQPTPPVPPGSAGPSQSAPSSGEGPAPVSGASSEANPISAAAAAARKPLGGTTGAQVSPTTTVVQPTPVIRRQPSNRDEDDELESQRQGPSFFPAPQVVRPTADVVRITPSQRTQQSQEVPVTAADSSTRVSPVGSMKELSSAGTTRTEQRRVEPHRSPSGSSAGSKDSASHDSRRPEARQLSMPRSGSTSQRPAATTVVSHGLSPQQLSNEGSQASAQMFMGHAPPPTVVRPSGHVTVGPAAQTATAPGGNMNMSIRSVKYQESDFDDEEDEPVPFVQPKPVRRVVDDDEYQLTEDEEAQQDMGIEDTEDFSPVGHQPKILMRPTTSSAGSPTRLPVPSRLGTQPTPAVAQSRGWATDEPLQAAPKPIASPQQTETAELEELESIHSFDNSNSQSIRRPGAWGSPSGTMRKPSMQRETREPSRPLSRVSKQSGWNETIKSFGADSGQHEVQTIQEISGVESFTDSVRQVGRGAPQRGPVSTSQAGPAPAPRQIQHRRSFSSELSDIEYA